ncbi:hypothetical protein [Haladaptatus sp. NG-WS-4]
MRERIVQVKLETDEKALADHDHPDLRAKLAELEALKQAVTELDRLGELVTANRERMDSGFENFESVLDYLTETTDELDDRLDVTGRQTRRACSCARVHPRPDANARGTKRRAGGHCGTRPDCQSSRHQECQMWRVRNERDHRTSHRTVVSPLWSDSQ